MSVSSLCSLYADIQNCHVCPGMDSSKHVRRTDAIELETDVFVISQSLAKGTLRLTGVNFFKPDGTLGSTGRLLEKFLNQFSRTVYPLKEVVLENGARIPAGNPVWRTVYNTEVAQCYPGKASSGMGDRIPTEQEVLNCQARGFLAAELAIIRPKLVFLMGKKSRDTFFKYYLKENHPSTLGAHIDDIVQSGTLPQRTFQGLSFFVCPIQHAAGGNPWFGKMSRNNAFIEIIAASLQAQQPAV